MGFDTIEINLVINYFQYCACACMKRFLCKVININKIHLYSAEQYEACERLTNSSSCFLQKLNHEAFGMTPPI